MMRDMFKQFSLLVFSAMLVIFLFPTCKHTQKTPLSSSRNNQKTPISIVSPYKDVNWETFGQYKAALHVHTSRSDGAHTLSQMVEDHYAKGYDILAITDHNVLNRDWTSGPNALAPQRYIEITQGAGRNGRGMIRIPEANEQSHSEHLNTFFAPFNNTFSSSLIANIKQTQEIGGLSFINHPGRYYRETITGANNPSVIKKYADLFLEFPSCVGLEIINYRDRYTVDRILWDNILIQTAARGRYVWGFSNDDTHTIQHTGFSYNIFVMPKNTVENFRAAFISGSFYAVAQTAKLELGADFAASPPAPVITNIKVDDNVMSITITALNMERIEWIADGQIISSGDTLFVLEHHAEINFYVRANILGHGGVVFTQPFGVLY